jgi:hypothetical protein
MNILISLLRLLHILSAFAWFGLGATMALYVAPAAVASGESGLKFLRSLFLTTPVARAIPITGGITTLAGIVLYLTGDPANAFSSFGNIVLGIGALAGIAAAIHGGMMTGRATRALAAALATSGDQPYSAEVLTSLRAKADALVMHSRVSFVLMAIALIGMASARYL